MDAASKAFTGWSQAPPAERARLFLRAAEIVKRRRSEIAEVLARETGCTISFATFQQDLVASRLEQVASWVYLPRARPWGSSQQRASEWTRRAVFRLVNGKIQSFNCYPSGTVIFGQLGVLSNIEAAIAPS